MHNTLNSTIEKYLSTILVSSSRGFKSYILIRTSTSITSRCFVEAIVAPLLHLSGKLMRETISSFQRSKQPQRTLLDNISKSVFVSIFRSLLEM